MGYSEKSAKKAAKAELKRDKKAGKASSDRSPASEGPPVPSSAGPTPADRAAAAAERQVQLHKYRLWLSLIAVLVAVAGLAWSVKPWHWLNVDRQPAPVEKDRVAP